MAIVKALEPIEKSHINDCIPKTATVHTDSRIALQSVKNKKSNYKYSFCLMVEASDHVYVWPQTYVSHVFVYVPVIFFAAKSV